VSRSRINLIVAETANAQRNSAIIAVTFLGVKRPKLAKLPPGDYSP
jgi:hypothetical protein